MKSLMSNRRELQSKIASIFAIDAPHGRLQNAKEGFPQRFPSSRRGLRFSTPFRTHTHRKWGSIDNRGTAADRGFWKGGGRKGSTWLQLGLYEYGYGLECAKYAQFEASNKPQDPRA